MLTPELLHYFAAATTIFLAAIGGGIGQGIAGFGVINAMNRQLEGREENFKALIIGLALIESGIVIALVISLTMLLGTNTNQINWGMALSELGMGLAVGVSAAAISISSSFIVKAAAEAISRQPFFAKKIISVMLLAQSIIEAAVIFAFVVALLIRTGTHPEMDFVDGIKYFAAGLSICLGCIGPSAGQSIFAYAACKSIGINKKTYNKIFPFTLLSQAVIETPLVFCLLISLIIIYIPVISTKIIYQAAVLTASFTIGLGTIGASIGIGFAASKAVRQIAEDPNNYAIIVKTALLVEAFVESAVIYAMIVALLLIMKTT
jgi:F-type H+-transporting ATPase subunit c